MKAPATLDPLPSTLDPREHDDTAPDAASDRAAHIHEAHGIERSSEWPRVRREHLAKHPTCAASGLREEDGVKLEVHHIFPVHICKLLGFPELELEPANLITLARHPVDYHLLLGHLDEFASANLLVEPDAKGRLHGASDWQIRHDSGWIAKVHARLGEWKDWTEEQQAAMVQLIEGCFGRTEAKGEGKSAPAPAPAPAPVPPTPPSPKAPVASTSANGKK